MVTHLGSSNTLLGTELLSVIDIRGIGLRRINWLLSGSKLYNLYIMKSITANPTASLKRELANGCWLYGKKIGNFPV